MRRCRRLLVVLVCARRDRTAGLLPRDGCPEALRRLQSKLIRRVRRRTPSCLQFVESKGPLHGERESSTVSAVPACEASNGPCAFALDKSKRRYILVGEVLPNAACSMPFHTLTRSQRTVSLVLWWIAQVLSCR